MEPRSPVPSAAAAARSPQRTGSTRGVLQRLRDLSGLGAQTALVLRQRVGEWMGREPVIRDAELDERLGVAATAQQDLAQLASVAGRLASAYRECCVGHLQLASAVQDVRRHAPALADLEARHCSVAQGHHRALTAFAGQLDAFQRAVAEMADRATDAMMELTRRHVQFAQLRRELEVACAAYERVLGPGDRRATISAEAVAAAVAADQGTFRSAHEARVAASEARVVEGFNRLDVLRADMLRLAAIVGPAEVGHGPRVSVCLWTSLLVDAWSGDCLPPHSLVHV